jgi:hypothetical protein
MGRNRGACRRGRRGVRHLFHACFASLVVSAAAALLVSSADAMGTHPYTGISFGPEGPLSAAEFSEVQSVAIDQSTGTVYVYDVGAQAIYKFNSEGAPQNFLFTGTNVIHGVGGSGSSSENQIAVAPSGAPAGTSGDIYVANNESAIRVFSEAGAELGEIAQGGETCGVATDPAGNLYAGVFPETINQFTPTTNPPTAADKTPVVGAASIGLCNIAADGLGNVYPANFGGGGLYKLEGLSNSSSAQIDGSASTVAIEPTTNHVFADRRNEFREYDSVGDLLGSSGSTELAAGRSRGIAVLAGGSKVYVGSGDASRVDIFGPFESLVEAVAAPPSPIGGSEVTLRGSVNPAGQNLTSCVFEYGATAGYGSSVPCVGVLPPDEVPHPVQSVLTGLQPATSYHFRISVTSESSGLHLSADTTFRTAGAAIGGEFVPSNSFTEATLAAIVDPEGFPTTYHFQYLNAAAYDTEGFGSPFTGTTPELSVGSDSQNHEVTAAVAGLSPETTYHFRVVATSIAQGNPVVVSGTGSVFVTRGADGPGVGTCANEGIRAETGSLDLPDCRAYEQVTPAFKNGGQFGRALTADGPRVVTESFGNFAGTQNAGLLSTPYEFTRSDSGWATKPLDPPASNFASTSATTPLYSLGPNGQSLYGLRLKGQPVDAETLYVGDEGSFTPIGPEAPPSSWVGRTGESAGTASSRYLGLVHPAENLSAVVYGLVSPESTEAHSYLWPFDKTAPGGRPSLYQYGSGEQSAPSLVGVRGGNGSTNLISECGTSLGSFFSEDTYNAVSADGAIVYFTPWSEELAGSCESPSPPPVHTELYARVNGTDPGARTVAISEPVPADCSACNTGVPTEAVFQGASEDGSTVYFLTEQELLPGNPGKNLYAYSFDAPAGQRVICASHRDGGASAEVRGVVRVSENGSRVYFVASGLLTNEANSIGATPVLHGSNLYVHDLDTGRTKFVATLTSEDQKLWSSFDAGRQAEATPNGEYLLFASKGRLTPDDTSTVSQLFRYTYQTGDLVRISIGRRGFNNDGNSTRDPVLIPPGATAFAGDSTGPPAKLISNDGSYIVFESTGGLTPKALDHQVVNGGGTVASNVYEYHDGLVSLLTNGKDLMTSKGGGGEGANSKLRLFSAVKLLGMDSTGQDVFFTTASPLVPQDGDRSQDIYDARIEGGFASTGGQACAAESCQGAIGPTPSVPQAQTPNLVGPENPPVPKRKKHHKPKQPKHKKHQRHKKHGKASGGAKGKSGVKAKSGANGKGSGK